jgi:hypothetical protein
MEQVNTFKINESWCFSVGDHLERGFDTKDEAKMIGEKYLIEKRKEEAKKRKEEQKAKEEKAKEKEEE